ncbi:MAG: hypothetical protein QM628_15575 [Propionicimonas sp.]
MRPVLIYIDEAENYTGALPAPEELARDAQLIRQLTGGLRSEFAALFDNNAED